MKVKSFEDLQVWKDARVIVNMIYELNLLNKFFKDYGLRDQLHRYSYNLLIL